MWLLFCSLVLGEVPDLTDPVETIVVEAYQDIQIYVGPIVVFDRTERSEIETVIDSNAAFTYSSLYSRNAQVPSGINSWQPIALGERDLKVYNSDTIKFVWEDCNYRAKPLECSFRNDHYYLETVIHVDDNQLVVRSTLYDSDAQVVTTSSKTDNKVIRWIKQQAITTQQTTDQSPVQNILPQANCGSGNCSSGVLQVSNNTRTEVILNKPKEGLPIKWEIPHTLTDDLIRQVMMGVWTGVKLNK